MVALMENVMKPTAYVLTAKSDRHSVRSIIFGYRTIYKTS